MEKRPEKRGRGRPPKAHRNVHFKMAEHLVEWLEESAAKYGLTKTAIVEEALEMLQRRWESRPPGR